MAENVGDLAVRLTLNSSDFERGVTTNASRLADFTRDAERASSRTNDVVQRVSGGVTSAVAELKAGTVFDSATKQVEGFLGKLLGGPGAAGVFATAVIGAFGAVVSAARDRSREIAGIGKFADLLGDNTQGAQVASRVFERAGFDRDSARDTVLKFQSRIGQASLSGGPVADSLSRLGLSASELSNMGTARALEEIAASLSQVQNRYERAALAENIFSRSFEQLEPVLRSGRRAFDNARRDVEAFGVDATTIRTARETESINRELDDRSRRRTGLVSRLWDGAATGIASSWAQLRKTVADNVDDIGDFWGRFLGLQGDRPTRAIRRVEETADEAIAAAERAMARINPVSTGVTADAEKLATQWRVAADNQDRSARQQQIIALGQAGVLEHRLQELRQLDEILTRQERRKQLEQEIQGLVRSGRTDYEQFVDTIRQIETARQEGNLGFRDSLEVDRTFGEQFLRLERAFARQAGSGVLTGTRGDSLEAARLVAEQIARNQGTEDPQERVRRVLAAANEQRERHIRETTELGEIIARSGLAVAVIP